MSTAARSIPKPALAASVTQYTWNEQAVRYVDNRTGRFVSRSDVMGSLDAALESAKGRGRALSEQLRAGQLSLQDWETGMRQTVKEVHLYSAAAARGGWAQMSYADFGNVGPAMRFQYERLHNFGAQIAAGLPLDGHFMQRTELYMLSGRSSYHKQDTVVQREAGMTEERNILNPADHCDGCVGESARSWVPLGKLVPPGNRLCLSRCKCQVEYREGDPEAIAEQFAVSAPASMADFSAARSFVDDGSTEANRAIEKWAIDNYGRSWVDKLSPAEFNLLEDYAQEAYLSLNSALRAGVKPSDPKLRRLLGRMDSALNKATIHEDVVVYRAFHGFSSTETFVPGAEFLEQGYMSTTLTEKYALEFLEGLSEEAGQALPANQKYLARILVPKGTKGGGMEALYRSKEHEVLLHRGQRLRVVSVETGTEYTRINMEVVEVATPAPTAKPFEFAETASHSEMRNWAKANYGDWVSGLSTKEANAIADYAGSGYATINKQLRHGTPDWFVRDQIDLLDSALSKAELPEDIIAWRGMQLDSDYFQVGQEFEDKGYVSTTLSKRVVQAFIDPDRELPEGREWYLARIRVPQGAKGASIEMISANSENELLLARNQRFRVVSKKKVGNYTHVEMEVVLEETAESAARNAGQVRVGAGGSKAGSSSTTAKAELELPKTTTEKLFSTRAKVAIDDDKGVTLSKVVYNPRLQADGTYTGHYAEGKKAIKVVSRDGRNWRTLNAPDGDTTRIQVPEAAKDFVFPDLGMKVETHGNLQEDFLQQAVEGLRSVPLRFREWLKAKGNRKVVLTERTMLAHPELKGMKPRGWYEGATWDHAGGHYSPGGQYISISQDILEFGSTTKYTRETRTLGVMRHEMGHMIDAALGQPEFGKSFDSAIAGSDNRIFKDAYKRDLKAADLDATWDSDKGILAYFLQDGKAGLSEAFAEGFAILYGGGGGGAAQKYLFTKRFPETLKAIERILKDI